jgi:hypothetical protein
VSRNQFIAGREHADAHSGLDERLGMPDLCEQSDIERS